MTVAYPIHEAFTGPKDTLVSLASLAGKTVPPRIWHVPDVLPAGQVTLFNADGGSGKSTLALQLACATALGRRWLGWVPRVGGTLYMSAEDDVDEIHRRVNEISVAQDCGLEHLGEVRLWPMADEDAALAIADGGDRLEPTHKWAQLEAHVDRHKPALIVLDSLADVFGGNEINRGQARQFIGMLRGLAMRSGAAVLVLAHPSLSGMSSGSGSSGSTHWHNSVRSRLYMTTPQSEGLDTDPDIRVLSLKKSNYAAKIPDLRIRRRLGGFVLDDASGASLDMSVAQSRMDRIFLDMLTRYEAQGRMVSDRAGANYAPLIFSKDPLAKGSTKAGFTASMNRLFEADLIAVETVGPASRQLRKLVRVSVGGAE
jgi:RecA-family ATPase